jgi:hypothetical protein
MAVVLNHDFQPPTAFWLLAVYVKEQEPNGSSISKNAAGILADKRTDL